MARGGIAHPNASKKAPPKHATTTLAIRHKFQKNVKIKLFFFCRKLLNDGKLPRDSGSRIDCRRATVYVVLAGAAARAAGTTERHFCQTEPDADQGMPVHVAHGVCHLWPAEVQFGQVGVRSSDTEPQNHYPFFLKLGHVVVHRAEAASHVQAKSAAVSECYPLRVHQATDPVRIIAWALAPVNRARVS